MTTNINYFKTIVTVLDTETNNIDPTNCEIVEVAGAQHVYGGWQAQSSLLGVYGTMPPEASAKNNISNRMISGLDTFDKSYNKVTSILNWPVSKYYVAHNAKYDMVALRTSFGRMESTDDFNICEDKSRWICTYRLAKHVLSYDETITQFNLGYLRYKLDLPIEDSLMAHRAKDDTLVCAALLDTLVDVAIENGQITSSGDIGTQLNELCWSHIQVKIWPFGTHKGKTLEELDNRYYTWALANMSVFDEASPEYDYDLAESVRQVLEDRLNENPHKKKIA